MEAKLAEFRKKNASKTSLINWSQISFRLSSLFSYSTKTPVEQKFNEEIEEENEEKKSINNWQIILLKFFVWLTLYLIFIRLEFGAIYFIISLLYIMWSTLGSHRRRDQLSAYSVFNPNFEKIQGTFTAEDYDRQLRHGGSPFISS